MFQDNTGQIIGFKKQINHYRQIVQKFLKGEKLNEEDIAFLQKHDINI